MNSPELYIAQQGHGRPLVMLHGWAMHGGLLQSLADGLSESVEVWSVDLPGHGYSQGPQLACAEELLAPILPENCILLGWSLGGQIALRLALMRPQRVSGVILLGSTPRFLSGADWHAGLEPEILQQFADELGRDLKATLQRFLALQVRGQPDVRAALVRLRAALAARPAARPEALVQGLVRLRETDLRAVVPQVGQAALVLHGAADRLTPPAAGRWLAEHLPRATLAEIDGAAHAPFISHEEEVLAAVRGFLAAEGLS